MGSSALNGARTDAQSWDRESLGRNSRPGCLPALIYPPIPPSALRCSKNTKIITDLPCPSCCRHSTHLLVTTMTTFPALGSSGNSKAH